MPKRNYHTARLLKAKGEGADIRHWGSYAPMEYRPRSSSDAYPWALLDEQAGQYTHMSARYCIAVWPDGRWTNSTGDVVTRQKPWFPYTVIFRWSEAYLDRIYDPWVSDPKGIAFQVWASDGDYAFEFAEAEAVVRFGDEAIHLEHVVCLHGHAYEVGGKDF
ncbi:hypothetical protein ACFRMQ_11425 [Kitasatospora sp. NPDC056783]|uniref:hypothetical protein n=1 Tax=Kitasatospora sp. NPDC056783 TaxID=3345943 RepID=UPI0036912A39